MRILEKEEVYWLGPMINRAVKQAQLSPCQKSKRGAVVFRGERILGQGFNTPLYPRTCVPDICKGVCRFYTIHAERSACYDALSKGFDLSGASILHMKVKHQEAVAIGKASCLDCSAYLIGLKRDGMPINELILLHTDKEGKLVYKAHSIDEFFQNSLKPLK